ncbi:MAG: DEAD/DEAH box helicase family protein [Lachnospiraceae bacterium]|nr:DEAD/DEAH box helicase family protein [Lachnospiraceae bacterium]
MNEIESLKIRVSQLEKENEYLRTLLTNAGISFESEDKSTKCDKYDPNQGSRIIPKTEFTTDDANDFFVMFRGRMDLYSKRTVSKAKGTADYYPQCHKIWQEGCPKKEDKKFQCSKCKSPAFIRLGKEQIFAHLKGLSKTAEDVIGIYPLFPDDTCRLIVYDFDNHEAGADKHDFANTDDSWMDEVNALREICRVNGIDALVERSRSGRGAHVWIFFQGKIEASLARKFGFMLLGKGAESVDLKNFRYYDRMYPMQDHLPEGGFGNLIALPLQGQALKNGNSAFVDEHWNAYPDQWAVLRSKRRLSRDFIEEKIKEWSMQTSIPSIPLDEISEKTNEKPWNKSKSFQMEDVKGALHISLADAVYVKTSNLTPRIRNQIRRLAAFSNPEFYKNQAMGLSNFKNSSYIYLGEDADGYIRIPRGLLDNLKENCENAGIPYEIEDHRCAGHDIKVKFTGNLKESQITAVQALEKYDTGILHAATAFGKTVVSCDMIARKHVNTLILLQNSTLMEQWEKAIENFLEIDEEPPEYQTPSGRTRVRKSVVGRLQGAHDSTTGIIDIAMVGSLCKKGIFHEKLKQYGMVILDECHHAASDTIVDVLQEVRAKYVYGVTATPNRGDRLEKINEMLLGRVRYRFTSKDRAREQGIAHLVVPRFTRAVAPRFGNDRMHPNEAYELLRNNEDRDEMILCDVRKCVESGRTPVILSRYVDHSRKLYERLQGCADRIFLLSGENSKKEHRKIIEQMNRVSADESMILIGTGKLVGEGFDFPRLDTLIMATPVSGKNVVEQYAGRLNRDYEGKEDVIIYDYVDIHISVFEKMYNKRLKAYRQIGYDMYTETRIMKEKGKKKSEGKDEGKDEGGNDREDESAQSPGAIYDAGNYLERYRQDLCRAGSEIILSSPVISSGKVDELIEWLQEKQQSGVKVHIVTWKPDMYGFGDSAYWMELQERMRNAGFEMNLVEDYCLHYCIVDRELVWYGSMNFLGKEDTEDNLMRVCNKSIAAELLEMTFGDGNYWGERM